jgi:hypothetical protein
MWLRSIVKEPVLRAVEIMNWLREHYSKDCKPNTRETIRHQFAARDEPAGTIIRHPRLSRGLELLDKAINRIKPTLELGSGGRKFVDMMMAGI